jgi:hypothetical protein
LAKDGFGKGGREEEIGGKRFKKMIHTTLKLKRTERNREVGVGKLTAI